MSRRAAFTSALASAAIAAVITVMAFVLIADQESPTDSPTAVSILSERSALPATSSSPSGPANPPITFAELTRASVDWAAIYAQVVPSLVSVLTDAGAGSGFFVSNDGHVITNWHVVAGAEQLFVYMQDGNRLEAEFVAKDVGNDLALLKVDPAGLEIVLPTYSEVDEVQIGDPVGALGAPFNLPNSLTVGIVSALGRTRPNGTGTVRPLSGMIQTDAALNPGNSGGMLIDKRGRVIGIPTQIESLERVSSGIGFAVSADTMLRALPTLISGEDYEHTYLGVSVRENDAELEIREVVCGSAADDAGLRAGDHVLEVNGEPADSLELLLEALRSIKPGEEFSITIQRGLRRMTFEATAGAWPTEPTTSCG